MTSSPDFSLAGKLALVTGASRGLGWAMAQALAGAGAELVLNGRDAATLEARAGELRAAGRSCRILPFDVADSAAVTRAVASLKRLDILVSNAGIIARKPLLETSDAEWQSVIDTDLTAGFRLAREAARLMVPRRSGRIIIVSSIMGLIARPTIAGYVTAKSGLHGLVRALAVELATHCITVNAIAPAISRPTSTRPSTTTAPSMTGSASAPRPGAGAIPPSSAAPPCSSLRPPPPIAPARCWRSMAA